MRRCFLRELRRCRQHAYAKHCFSFSSQLRQEALSKIVSAAEKVVGYPTSFMNLRFWLSDEMSNVAVNMRKLIGTKHPLMKTAKGLLFDSKETMQTRGLIVLLLSTAAGRPVELARFERHHLDIEASNCDEIKPKHGDVETNAILLTQRSLAEITEMIHTAFVLHHGVMDIDLSENSADKDDLLYGNKMALLSGDYLLAKASTGLAALGNTHVVEVMASAIADLMESGTFLQDLEQQLFNSTCQRLTLDKWEENAFKCGACLYAKSCQSALMLANYLPEYSSRGFLFGKYIGLLRHLRREVKASEEQSTAPYSIFKVFGDGVDSTSCDIREKVLQLDQQYSQKALSAMGFLPVCDAKTTLQRFVEALG